MTADEVRVLWQDAIDSNLQYNPYSIKALYKAIENRARSGSYVLHLYYDIGEELVKQLKQNGFGVDINPLGTTSIYW